MHSFVTSKNVKSCHLIWPTLYSCAVCRLFQGTIVLVEWSVFKVVWNIAFLWEARMSYLLISCVHYWLRACVWSFNSDVMPLTRTSVVVDPLDHTQSVVCATICRHRKHFSMCLRTQYTLCSTSSSCWAPVPSSPRLGLMCRDPVLRTYVYRCDSSSVVCLFLYFKES